MNKALQDLAWSVLPKDFKEEVKYEWRHTDSNITKRTLEYFFGIHNLTSDADGEEMLVCKRSEVLWRYEESVNALKSANGMPPELRGLETGKSLILRILFGSKCLPEISGADENENH